VIEQICPADVHVCEAYHDDVPVDLFSEEAAIVARAVVARRAEFATVRHCARMALAQIDVSPVTLVPGEGGAPTWPTGVVGSMTHCTGYRAAAVAMSAKILTIGVDAEPAEPLPEGLFDLVAIAADSAVLPCGRGVSWDRVLFCAKEAVFKAWFPLARRFLGFDEVHVAIHRDGSFTADLLVEGPVVDGVPIRSFCGLWIVENGLIATAITVPCRAGGP
jgi:4'-phosphopantetheinyl transferase EntD